MNRNKALTLLLLIALLGFALLSFAPCLTLRGHYTDSLYAREPNAPTNVGYFPHFCCILTAAELLLLLLPAAKPRRRVVGMVLTVLKLALPVPLLTRFGRLMESVFPHSVAGSYSLNPPGYGLLALGVLTLALYACSILALSGPKPGPKPGAAAPAQPRGFAVPEASAPPAPGEFKQNHEK